MKSLSVYSVGVISTLCAVFMALLRAESFIIGASIVVMGVCIVVYGKEEGV